MMNSEIKSSYINFYNQMARAYCETNNDNPLGSLSASIAIESANFAKSHYLILKENEVEDIEHIRGCLNTLEKKLGMEVT